MRRQVFALVAAVLSLQAGAEDAFVSCHGERLSGSSGLLPCPDRPNCVSSTGPEAMAALRAPEGADPRAALRAAIEAETGGQISLANDRVIIATFESSVFKFVDEAHFLIADDGRIEFRSAACSGYYDFGVNRRRIERIRGRLER